MKVVILYHLNREFGGMAEDYAKEYHNRHQDRDKIELTSLETVEGSELAKLYDIVLYPAMLAVANDGHLQKLWQDLPWPLMDEVAAYSVPGS